MSSSPWQRLVSAWRSACRYWQVELWRAEELESNAPRRTLNLILRVVSVTGNGLFENRAASRAASLSFSSLLGLGPLIALAVMVAGFLLDDTPSSTLAVDSLNQIITFIAPQVGQLTDSTPHDPNTVHVNESLVNLINGFITNSRSSAVGVIGALTLIFIVIQLFTSIENAFNEIWGVRQGRSWFLRIVYYWTILTLGALGFFGAFTGLSASALLNAFAESVPYGNQMIPLFRSLLPLVSIAALILVLTLFYRNIPNTHVYWSAAALGALIVALLLLANNYLAFLYFRRVVLSQSLYGSLGILPVLMFGLFVFWFFVLLGGQVSYAAQNVRFRNTELAWEGLSEASRRRLSLSVFIAIARRFHYCEELCTVSQLSEQIQMPAQLINKSLSQLKAAHLITQVPPDDDNREQDQYQPAKPLSRITLADLKNAREHNGHDPLPTNVVELDPIVSASQQAHSDLSSHGLWARTIEDLIEAHPLPATTTPPAQT